MKKRTLIFVLTLMVSVLVLTGSAFALGYSPRRVTGDVGLEVPQWGDLLIWIHFDAQQVNPVTHRANGTCSWMIYSPTDGWRYLDARPICVAFGQDGEGKRTAVLVSRIVRRAGWGWGEAGEYAKFWVRDGGTPGGEDDQWMMQSYQFDPEWIEFWPADVPPPDCESFTPDGPPIAVKGGGLAID